MRLTRKKVLEALDQAGFSLARRKKNLIFKHSDGRTISISNNPSSSRYWKNLGPTLRRYGVVVQQAKTSFAQRNNQPTQPIQPSLPREEEPTMPSKLRNYIGPQDLAAKTGIAISTIWGWKSRGIISEGRGRSYLIDNALLDALQGALDSTRTKVRKPAAVIKFIANHRERIRKERLSGITEETAIINAPEPDRLLSDVEAMIQIITEFTEETNRAMAEDRATLKSQGATIYKLETRLKTAEATLSRIRVVPAVMEKEPGIKTDQARPITLDPIIDTPAAKKIPLSNNRLIEAEERIQRFYDALANGPQPFFINDAIEVAIHQRRSYKSGERWLAKLVAEGRFIKQGLEYRVPKQEKKEERPAKDLEVADLLKQLIKKIG